MEEKKIVQVVITKYYLLAWLFGLAGLLFLYFDSYLMSIIGLYFCLSYSIADCRYPAPPIKSNESPKDKDSGDGPSPA